MYLWCVPSLLPSSSSHPCRSRWRSPSAGFRVLVSPRLASSSSVVPPSTFCSRVIDQYLLSQPLCNLQHFFLTSSERASETVPCQLPLRTDPREAEPSIRLSPRGGKLQPTTSVRVRLFGSCPSPPTVSAERPSARLSSGAPRSARLTSPRHAALASATKYTGSATVSLAPQGAVPPRRLLVLLRRRR